MSTSRVGSVAWYVTGRFYVTQDKKVEDLGYFIHLNGIDGALFSGDVGESTAHFTFRSQPFKANRVTNGSLSLSLDPVGTFGVYFQETPVGNFNDPNTFSQGEEIAVFQRVSVVVGQTLSISNNNVSQALFASNVFTAKLLSSKPFNFCGKRYDLKELLPNGITQWGTASTESTGPVKDYISALPFVGSAIVL